MEGRGLQKGFTFTHSPSPASLLHIPFAPTLQPLNPTSALKKKKREREKVESFTLNLELSRCETFKLPALIVFSSSTQTILTCIKSCLSAQSDH